MKFALKKKPLEVAFAADPTFVVELRRPTGAEQIKLRNLVSSKSIRKPAINPDTHEPIFQEKTDRRGKASRDLVYDVNVSLAADDCVGILTDYVTGGRGLDDPETGLPVDVAADPSILLEATFDYERADGNRASLFGDILDALTGFAGTLEKAKGAGDDSGKADSGKPSL